MRNHGELLSMMRKPVIYIDADACPVKSEINDCAKIYNLETVFVASIKNSMKEPTEGRWVYVDWDKEAADLYIMNHVHSLDICITADIGLAAGLLGKKVYVLSPKGIEYDDFNIQSMLAFRHISAKNRRSGKHSKGPKAFTSEDKKVFSQNLLKILSNHAGIL